MAKTWYPVIDYLTCAECGTCSATCPHGVYDPQRIRHLQKSEACMPCQAAGTAVFCAITYLRRYRLDTAERRQESEGDGCFLGCDTSSERIVVEYLYLDCIPEPRIGTDTVLDEVMETITPALRLAGFDIEYNKIEMKTAEFAERFRFLSSPTIRVNGQDICGFVKENSCGFCSEISGTDVDCRIFDYYGESYEVPPNEMLQAILKNYIWNNS